MEKILGLTKGSKFQIYRRRLREGTNQTSCIVLTCAKQDVPLIQSKLTNYREDDLGKEVEFILYRMASYWSEKTYLEVFRKQNQYIEEVGVLPIQGITE